MEGLMDAQERPRRILWGKERPHDLLVQLANGALFFLFAHVSTHMYIHAHVTIGIQNASFRLMRGGLGCQLVGFES